MGILAKALSGPSSAAAKKSGVYEDIKDRIDGAILPADLDEVERWLDANDHLYPTNWRDSLNDMIELKREEIEEENVSSILRARYDF